MQLGQKGLDLIKSFEGCILYSYDDLTEKRVLKDGACKGTLTIGYGHTGSDVKKGMTITKAQAETLLKKDMAVFEKAVNKYVTSHKLNQNQFDALVSFAFNCGSGALNKVMTSSDITTSMSKYVHSKGILLKGLQRRREAEIKLYNTSCKQTTAAQTTVAQTTQYYKKCASNKVSITDALNSIGVTSSFANRKAIATKNGIKNYTGTAQQNITLLNLLKTGKLKK